MRRAALILLLTVGAAGSAAAQPTAREAARRRAMLEGRLPNPALLAYDGVTRRTKYVGGDPMFIAALSLSELAGGVARGDVDAAGDVVHALTTPELYASTAVFHGSFTGATIVADRVGPLLARPLPPSGAVAKAGELLKTNLVLTAALTTTQLVEIDFGGFTFRDALEADLTKLKDARIGLRDVPAEDLLLTAGSVAAAVPLWAGAKEAAAFAGKRLAARVAVTAGAQAATIWIPVGGQVFNGVVAAGHVVWFAVDLAGLIILSHGIEGAAKGYRNHSRARDDIRDAIRSLLATSARSGGAPPREELEAALRRVQLAFRDYRALNYEKTLTVDARLAQRLIRWGIPESAIGELSSAAANQYGRDLADVATTVLLKRTTDTMRADPTTSLPGRARGPLVRSLEGYRRSVRRALRKIYEADRLPDGALLTGLRTKVTRRGARTVGRPFRLAENQTQIYEQEAAVYAAALARLTDPTLRAKLRDEAALVRELRDLDRALADEAMRDDDPTAAAAARRAALEATETHQAPPVDAGGSTGAPFKLPTADDIPTLDDAARVGLNQLLEKTTTSDGD